MTSITVLVVGGTSESFAGDTRTEVSGMLSNVTKLLDDRFTCRWVGYPAAYGPVVAFRQSVAEGAARLAAELENTTGPVVLLGYSQGCTVVRQLLDDQARSWTPAGLRISVVGLVADPEAPPDPAVPDRFGVLGYTSTKIPYWVTPCWASNPDDPICRASADSLLRTFADFTQWFGFDALCPWLESVAAEIQRRMTAALLVPTLLAEWRTLEESWAEVLAYLPRVVVNPTGGQHTAAYTDSPSLLPDLANQIKQFFTKSSTPSLTALA